MSVGRNAKDSKADEKNPATGSAAKYEVKGSNGAANNNGSSKGTDLSTNVPKTPNVSVAVPSSDHAAQEKIQYNMTSASLDDEKQVPLNMASESVGTPRLPPGTEHTHLERNDFSASQITLFCVGDVVKVKFPDGTEPEGLVMEICTDAEKVLVDFCSEGFVREVYAADCDLVVKSDVMEVGDQVQVQPKGSAIYFVGRVSQINNDGTYDVMMEGDDPDDIEFKVPPSNIRKLMSRRALVVARWKRAKMVVSSMNNFQSFVVDPTAFSNSARATKEASVKAANTALYASAKPAVTSVPEME